MSPTKDSPQSQGQKDNVRFNVQVSDSHRFLLLLCSEVVKCCLQRLLSFVFISVDKDPNFEFLFAFYIDTELVSSHDKSELDLLK